MATFDADGLLRKYYPGMAWRTGQKEVVEHILAGRDVLAVMPTGSGKSLCYQLPALALPGMTLVISPLIALMNDQVQALRRRGIAAAYLNRSLNSREYREVLTKAGQGGYDLLYIAPERLASERFLRLMQEASVPLVAVDEAHCISQWGHDFRPDYLQIRQFIEALPQRPMVAAFTATAGTRTQDDIIAQLGLPFPFRYCQGFDRPNLYLGVVYPRDKFKFLCRYLQRDIQRSGIIYCSTRNAVDELSRRLRSMGLAVTAYHAGMTNALRRSHQDAFVRGECPVMVATNAFGMGIDKPDIAFVIHYQLPLSLEAYYQEIGRAGRDGRPADCLLLYHEKDQDLGRYLIDHALPDVEAQSRRKLKHRQKEKYRQLQLMDSYARHRGCRRHSILGYFGQNSPTACGNCSACRGYPEQPQLKTIIEPFCKAISNLFH